MGRRIRWLGVVLILCFGLVIVQLTNIQFRQASALAQSPDNPVNRVPNFDNHRGEHPGRRRHAAGRVGPHRAARAPRPTSSQRQYPTGPLFSQIVGTTRPIYCDTGVEGYYNDQLGLHKQSAQTLSQLLSPPPPTTDNITLTVDPDPAAGGLSELADLPGPNKDGAIVMLDPQTGAVLAMDSQPDLRPDPARLARLQEPRSSAATSTS